MKTSILIPSRGRPDLLRRCVQSILQCTHDLKSIEVLVAVDFNDPEFGCYAAYIQIIGRGDLDIRMLARRQSDNLSDDYYNAMARMSTGDFIWVLNDDCEIETRGWDKILRKITFGLAPGLYYLDTYDTTRNFNNNGEFACFPMISRHLFDALGYFFHPQIRTWGADRYLHFVCDPAGCVINAQDIRIRHHREAKDQTSGHMKKVFKEDDLSTIRERIDFDREIGRIKEAVFENRVTKGEGAIK